MIETLLPWYLRRSQANNELFQCPAILFDGFIGPKSHDVTPLESLAIVPSHDELPNVPDGIITVHRLGRRVGQTGMTLEKAQEAVVGTLKNMQSRFIMPASSSIKPYKMALPANKDLQQWCVHTALDLFKQTV